MKGYSGKFLWVDLSEGKIWHEIPDDQLLRDYVGGYGVAARILYDRQRPLVDPLGPENIFVVATGPLTGSPAPTGTRWTVAAKSPLTGTWGDANGSGFFGVTMKATGYDAMFFKGLSAKPVYLSIIDGKAELHDASFLWEMDTYQIDDHFKAAYGQNSESVCIGPAGEKLSLISGIFHLKGRAAARSGLGAVMGSKKLKAVVVRGNQPFTVANPEKANALKRKYTKQIIDGTGLADSYRTTGTPGYTAIGARNGDSPTRNWGVSTDHGPDPAPLMFNELLKYRHKREACAKCPIACWGSSEIEWDSEKVYAHQPEYETGSAFGSMLMNKDLVSLIKANELCNRLGMDSISAGSTVAFALECYEHGLLTTEDTGGLRLEWDDPAAIIKLTEMIAMREGVGDLLADGVKVAAKKLGPKAETFAIHVHGQELPMHDPRFEPAMGVIYKMDATPGRHTQACQFLVPPGFETASPQFGSDPDKQEGRGHFVKEAACLFHTVQATGICMFGYLSTRVEFVPEFMEAVTGEPFDIERMMTVGERIHNLRQAFNIREGVNLVKAPIPLRAYGKPPLPDGPTAGREVMIDEMLAEYLEDLDWTKDEARPRARKLKELGLVDVAADLWPEAS